MRVLPTLLVIALFTYVSMASEDDDDESCVDYTLPNQQQKGSILWSSKNDQQENKPYLIILVLILGFSFATILSLAACVLLWFTFFYLYKNVYRIFWSLEEKLRIATKRLSDRRFGDDIMAQMRQMAPYDANRNDQEISTMLKSVYNSQAKAAPQPR